ncbi:MAG: response regulator, partial [Bacteroidota bacterium]
MNAEHILIVEDDIIAQMTLSQMLEDMGYASVSTASNMKETQAILTSEPIDLALLDVFLHGEREGIKVAEFIHRNRTPFIFLTASHDSETYHLMNELNHSGILEKPYDYDDINHAVLNVLSTISKASESDSAVPESLTDLETNLIFDSIAIGVCVINNQGKIIRANDAICEIFDLPTDRVKNSKLEELIPGIKGSARLSKDLIKNRVAHEERIVTKHGKTIDLSITQAGFRSGEGIYQVVTVTDISSQKKSLKQLEEQVVKNNELIAEIHDRVKNSLNTVSGLLYLKEQNQSDKDAKNQFKKVRQRVRLLAKIHTLFFRDDILKTILSKEFVKSLALEISAIFMTGVIIKPKKVSSFQL